MAEEKIIFSMTGVSKIYPPNKQVLKDIYLSFFYGAKIGVLGLNGSGKSSLLRIIAGVDKEFQGEVVSDLTFSVGLLEQEPKLDKTRTVKEVVEEAPQKVSPAARAEDAGRADGALGRQSRRLARGKRPDAVPSRRN